jgi:hypothetical protein
MRAKAIRTEVRVAVPAIAALFLLLYVLQVRIDAITRSLPQQREELVLRSGRMLKKMSLGYDALLADLYWTRTVQYYGLKLLKDDPNFELLSPLLDLTTELDPQLIVAYKFGAVFLSEHPPAGAGRPDLAEQLIRRGIAANPDQWRFWADLGFVYYWYEKDYASATDAYMQGSRQPQSPIWMKAMAASISAQGGSYRTSYFLWSEIYQSTQDPTIRKNALKNLWTLRAEEDAQHLQEIGKEFFARFHRYPSSSRELVGARMLHGVPVDPAGYPYVFAPDGSVWLNPSSTVTSGKIQIIPKR